MCPKQELGNEGKAGGAGLRARRGHKLMVRRSLRKTFQGSCSGAFGAPVNYEESSGASVCAYFQPGQEVRKTHPTLLLHRLESLCY